MSFFNKLFSSNKNQESDINFQWQPLTSLSQLEEIEILSKEKKVVLFKHSTSCGISRMVLNRFEQDFEFSEKETVCYYLDLLRYREISNEVASRFQVIHQSPQVLVISNGMCVKNASHYAILEMEI